MQEILGSSNISFVFDPVSMSPPPSEDFLPGKPTLQFGEMEIRVVDSPFAMPPRKITTPKRKRPEKTRHVPGFTITLSTILEEDEEIESKILQKEDAIWMEEICGNSSISFLTDPASIGSPQPEDFLPGYPKLQFGEMEINVVDSPYAMPPRRPRKLRRRRPEKRSYVPGYTITLPAIIEEEESLEKGGGGNIFITGEITRDPEAAGDARTRCETRPDEPVLSSPSLHSYEEDLIRKEASCLGSFEIFGT